MPFLLLYALAGLMVGAAPAVIKLAQNSEVRNGIKRRKEFEAEMLAMEIDLQDLRDEAQRRGIDPVVVMRGYDELRKGNITVDKLEKLISSLIPIEDGQDDD